MAKGGRVAVGVFAGGNAWVAITVFSELIAVGDTVDGMLGEVHAENKIKKKMMGIQARADIHCLQSQQGIRAPLRAPRVGGTGLEPRTGRRTAACALFCVSEGIGSSIAYYGLYFEEHFLEISKMIPVMFNKDTNIVKYSG